MRLCKLQKEKLDTVACILIQYTGIKAKGKFEFIDSRFHFKTTATVTTNRKVIYRETSHQDSPALTLPHQCYQVFLSFPPPIFPICLQCWGLNPGPCIHTTNPLPLTWILTPLYINIYTELLGNFLNRLQIWYPFTPKQIRIHFLRTQTAQVRKPTLHSGLQDVQILLAIPIISSSSSVLEKYFSSQVQFKPSVVAYFVCLLCSGRPVLQDTDI